MTAGEREGVVKGVVIRVGIGGGLVCGNVGVVVKVKVESE